MWVNYNLATGRILMVSKSRQPSAEGIGQLETAEKRDWRATKVENGVLVDAERPVRAFVENPKIAQRRLLKQQLRDANSLAEVKAILVQLVDTL